jgi:hypothetical protein
MSRSWRSPLVGAVSRGGGVSPGAAARVRRPRVWRPRCGGPGCGVSPDAAARSGPGHLGRRDARTITALRSGWRPSRGLRGDDHRIRDVNAVCGAHAPPTTIMLRRLGPSGDDAAGRPMGTPQGTTQKYDHQPRRSRLTAADRRNGDMSAVYGVHVPHTEITRAAARPPKTATTWARLRRGDRPDGYMSAAWVRFPDGALSGSVRDRRSRPTTSGDRRNGGVSAVFGVHVPHPAITGSVRDRRPRSMTRVIAKTGT